MRATIEDALGPIVGKDRLPLGTRFARPGLGDVGVATFA